MRRSIPQEDSMGCSVACVAFATDRDYGDARELFTIAEKARLGGYNCQEIVHALKRAGLDYSFRKINDKTRDLLEITGAIVLITDPKYPHKHYLINTERGWMDSWTNLPQTPAESGFRKELPGEPEWVIYPK